jgi:hypothetical protein
VQGENADRDRDQALSSCSQNAAHSATPKSRARFKKPGSSWCYDGEEGTCGISVNLYADNEAGSVREESVLASLGCSNPTVLAELSDCG